MLYGKVRNLKYLYLWNSSDLEIQKLCSTENGIASYEIPTLQYFAIAYGDFRDVCSTTISSNTVINNKVTDISYLSNLNPTTKNAIKYLSLENNRITSIESLKDFKNIYLLRIQNNLLKSLSGIENMKELTYLYVRNNMLGSETEISNSMNIDMDSLSAIAEVDTSSGNIDSYIFTANNPKLYSIDLSNNENLIWCNYLADCKNISYLDLSNCNNLNGNAIISLRTTINRIGQNAKIPSKYSLSILDENTTKIDITNLEIEKSIFESLGQYKNVKSFNMKNAKILEGGIEITGDKLNELINEVLSNYTKITHIGLEGITTLKDISFVKNMNNLLGMDLRNTSVSTTDETIGLQLLNDYAPNIKVLLVSDSTIDLSKIQECINKLDGDAGNNDIFSNVEYGFICYNNNVLKTLEKCTEITQFTSCYQGTGAFDSKMDLDLTACKNLRKIRLLHITFEVVKLPESIETIEHTVNGNSKLDASNCIRLSKIAYSANSNLEFLLNTIQGNKSLSSIVIQGNVDVPIFLNNINKLKECTNLTSVNLSQVHWENSKIALESIENIKKLSNLKKLSLNMITIGDNDFSSIGDLQNLTNLTITNTNLKDISFLENLQKLQEADLSNNQITNGIIGLSNLTNLESLNLSNNALFDMSSKDGVNYRNLEILGNLNYANSGKLKQLYLAGNNNITDWSYVSKYTWPNGKSGF